MSLRLISIKKAVVAIMLLVFIGNLQAGWLDDNLDKLKKAKDLLNSAQKHQKKKEPKKEQQKQEDKLDKNEQSVQTNKNPTQSSKKPSSKVNKENNALIYGEVINISLGNKGKFKTLTLPTYKGVMMSLGKSYPVSLKKLQKKTGMGMSPLRLKLGVIARERANNYYLYQKLHAIKLSYKTLDKKKLTQLLLKPSSLAGTNEEITLLISWKNIANYLAVLALSDKSYAKYFCGSLKCNIAHDRVSQQRSVTFDLPYWGGLGNKNEFKKRKLIKEFIDNEFTALVEWSKNHTFYREEYVLGEMILPHYNFKKGYFDLKLRINPDVLGNDKIIDDSVKMSANKAEALVKKHKNNRLYYIYKVASSISKISYVQQTKKIAPYRMTYDFKVNSNAVEFFWNTKLTDKWRDIPIRLRKMNKGEGAKSILNGAGGLSKRMVCFNASRTHRRNPAIYQFAAMCSQACQKAKNKILHQPSNSQSEIDQCNTAYDEFWAALDPESKAAANHPTIDKRHNSNKLKNKLTEQNVISFKEKKKKMEEKKTLLNSSYKKKDNELYQEQKNQLKKAQSESEKYEINKKYEKQRAELLSKLQQDTMKLAKDLYKQ